MTGLTYTDGDGKRHSLHLPLLPGLSPGFIRATGEDGKLVQVHQTEITNYNMVPFNKSERCFRVYEGWIKEVVNRWPNPCYFDPEKFSVNTCIGRVRDAMASLLEYNWPTDIDVDRFRNLRPLLVVAPGPDNTVCIAPREHFKTEKVLSSMQAEITRKAGEVGLQIAQPDHDTLEALCLLHSKEILTTPSFVKNVSMATMDDLASRYEITISEDGKGYLIL